MTKIEVAYATPGLQKIIECEIEQGTSAREAVRQSKIDEFFPEMDLDQCDLGVFGKQVLDSYELLLDGDRIEIYR
ncbi:MAG: RnfH family protein, partial [Aestuariibacter sp.]|nr:RnfH family protein [Aestuariibacter sp.]